MKKKLPLKLIINSVSNEKGISEHIIFDAIKEAIICTTKKRYSIKNVTAEIDKKNGIYRTYMFYNIVNDKIKKPFQEISLNIAKKINIDFNIGDIVKKEIKSINFGRIDSYIAKQIITKRVKKAKRNLIINEFIKKKGKILLGTIKKFTREDIIFDFENGIEGILKKKNSIPKEPLKIGNKIKVCLLDVSKNIKDPELILSRTCNNILKELLRKEIPEINEDIIEIKDIVRDPGLKSKVSVKTKKSGLDPIGICVGTRGIRLQTISNELFGEKIDIILWNNDPVKYLINALHISDKKYITVHCKQKYMDIKLNEELLPKIIGKNGHNIKLTSKLIKWELKIYTKERNK